MNKISDEENLKRVCVKKKKGRFFYPKTLPRERKPMTHGYLIVIVMALIVHFCLASDKIKLISLYALSIFCYFGIILVSRIILFIYELPHALSTYENNYGQIVKAAFTFNTKSIIALLVCFFYLIFYWTRYGWLSLDTDYWIIIIVVLYFWHKLLELDSTPANDSRSIAQDNGLDYGSGMAYSFYYGYLNYILPKTGDLNKNLKEMMQDYENQHDIEFAAYKIFILIPKSLNCHVSIVESSKLMEPRSSLADKIITVAGVRDRVYRNSVYTIKHEKTGTFNYVCTEYATPLKTFKEVVKNTTRHTEYYTRHKNDILLQFYLTLMKILKHEQMDNMCELVYYDDMDPNKEQYYDVGRIILEKIVEYKKEQENNQNYGKAKEE